MDFGGLHTLQLCGAGLKRFPHFRVAGNEDAVDLSSNSISRCGWIPPTVTVLSVRVRRSEVAPAPPTLPQPSPH